MKKVSFINGVNYARKAVLIFGSDYIKDVLLEYFKYDVDAENWLCIKSFTAEITVKIVPYEEV